MCGSQLIINLRTWAKIQAGRQKKKKRNDRKKNLSSELSHVFAKPTFNHIALRSCLCPAGVEPVDLWEKEDHSVWLKDREQRVSASVGLYANI